MICGVDIIVCQRRAVDDDAWWACDWCQGFEENVPVWFVGQLWSFLSKWLIYSGFATMLCKCRSCECRSCRLWLELDAGVDVRIVRLVVSPA